MRLRAICEFFWIFILLAFGSLLLIVEILGVLTAKISCKLCESIEERLIILHQHSDNFTDQHFDLLSLDRFWVFLESSSEDVKQELHDVFVYEAGWKSLTFICVNSRVWAPLRMVYSWLKSLGRLPVGNNRFDCFYELMDLVYWCWLDLIFVD